MNLVPMYVELRNRARIPLSSYPSSTQMYSASIVAIEFLDEDNRLRYYVRKCKNFNCAGQITSEKTFHEIYHRTKEMNPQAIILVTPLTWLSQTLHLNIRGDILRLLEGSRELRGEPENGRM